MAHELVKKEITAVLSEAGKGVSFWIEHLDRYDLEKLQTATEMIKTLREIALRREQSKIS